MIPKTKSTLRKLREQGHILLAPRLDCRTSFRIIAPIHDFCYLLLPVSQQQKWIGTQDRCLRFSWSEQFGNPLHDRVIRSLVLKHWWTPRLKLTTQSKNLLSGSILWKRSKQTTCSGNAGFDPLDRSECNKRASDWRGVTESFAKLKSFINTHFSRFPEHFPLSHHIRPPKLQDLEDRPS